MQHLYSRIQDTGNNKMKSRHMGLTLPFILPYLIG